MIETLIAAALAVLILATLYTSWSSVTRIESGWHLRNNQREKLYESFSVICDDITRFAPIEGRPELDVLSLEITEGWVLRLTSAHTADDLHGDSWYRIEQVLYRLDQNGLLWRKTADINTGEANNSDLSEDGEPIAELKDFEIRLFDGQVWRETWNYRSNGIPQAAHVRMLPQRGTEMETRLWIPVGQLFKPAKETDEAED